MKTTTRTILIVLLGGLCSIAVLYKVTISAGAARTNRATIMQATSQSEEKVIHINAKKFECSPSTITLKKGEPVVFELSSEDRTHGFNLKEFGIRAEVKPSEVTRLRFTPDKTGDFTFSCDVVCGGGHAEMFGRLVVTD